MINAPSFHVAIHKRLPMRDIMTWLDQNHYTKVDNARNYGEFGVHGDRLVVRAVNYRGVIAIDFFGNVVERCAETLGDARTDHRTVRLAPNVVDDDGVRFLPGEFVVHLDQGIGQFKTVALREVTHGVANKEDPFAAADAPKATASSWRPFLVVEYADGAELFVPPEQTRKLTHYIGARRPVLSRLGSKRWQGIKQKVEADLYTLAKDLLLVAAQRQMHSRPPLAMVHEWVDHIAQAFPYSPTDDQEKAIDAVLTDFRLPKPMDRLICGDVGFGKTEVALRAAAAVVSAGKQVAILAPTTILVEQHLATFRARFKGLPVRIAGLSRFASMSEINHTLGGIAHGTVDIVIGTHRLFASDVQFKELGLLIIDEEQKFGVKHKERLKQKRLELDVLTLSATPIPRTLFAGLSGLRDISLIMTPPKNRRATVTNIMPHSDEAAREAINLELARGGQVFVVHNDVTTIQARVRVLQKLAPGARIAVAHGQMPEATLAAVLRDMSMGAIDVLVTSTIIENGIDMPRVNTLIVEKCDHFGLADLYQIRGRVGRSAKQAYAYFFYDTLALTRSAESRFKALQESTALGSGYSIAMRDLEIRGGGNVLGKEQHGNMEAVGLSLYAKLLQLTVQRLQREKILSLTILGANL